MDDIEAILTPARRSRALGYLKEAATQLESACAQQKHPKVLSELADVLIYQGYWEKARSILEEGLKAAGDHAERSLDSARMQMKLCFIRPVIECFFGQNITIAERLHREHLLHIDWSTTSRDEVYARPGVNMVSL
jgi:hypothetical protein